MRTEILKPIMTEEESDLLAGKFLEELKGNRIYTTDVDVIDKVTGNVIAKFRKNIIPGNVQRLAFDNLLAAATPADNRGTAAGFEEKARTKRINKDGSVSKQSIGSGAIINSGVAGFMDRSTRFPHCRLTAFNKHNLDKFKNAYPIMKFVDNHYAKLMPKQYKAQRKAADNSSKDFVIPNTAFTTLTVNKNWQTAVHKDAGDFKEGFGNLVALRKGKFTGGHFVLPRWGCGFDLQNGDLLLVDVHQWHGNTPIIKVDEECVRLSLVMYYRENIAKCESMEEELKRVQKRKKGDPLHD